MSNKTDGCLGVMYNTLIILSLVYFAGTAAAFRKVYEEPIVASRQPSCSAEERELGECRATEVSS